MKLRSRREVIDWMNSIISDDPYADEAGTSATTTPEYNTNSVKNARLQSTLAALLTDPVLADVAKKPSLSDVDTLINLELGSAMRITVLKLDGTSFDVAVMDSATVKDLKLAIKKKANEAEESKMGHRHVSWKHVWANFCLLHHKDKLLNDDSALQDYGVRNNSQVQFIPFVVARTTRKHSRRRKHRFFHGLNRKVNDLAEAADSFGTLRNVVDYDILNDSVKAPRSLTRKLRRVRQGLDLIRALFRNFLSSDDCCLREAASTAYANTCAAYHTWAVRTAVYAGMYALPSRDQLLVKLNETDEAEREMRRYINHSLPVIDYIDKLFVSRNITLDW